MSGTARNTTWLKDKLSDGAVVAWRRRSVRNKLVLRLATRTWAVESQWYGSNRRRRAVLIHGRHTADAAGDNGADVQLDVAERWFAGRDGLLFGDINGTLCSQWRSGESNAQTAIDRRLRDFVGWRCYCKAGRGTCAPQLNTQGRVVGLGWEVDGRVRWTRRDRTSASRIDFAIRLGNGERWVAYDMD
eukprot:5846066-Prymnesium_polylepis.1